MSYYTIPTLDGNVHVVPSEVFTKILLGEMDVTDVDDWQEIVKAIISEWMRYIETGSKEAAS
jgi:hypothetical protein